MGRRPQFNNSYGRWCRMAIVSIPAPRKPAAWLRRAEPASRVRADAGHFPAPALKQVAGPDWRPGRNFYGDQENLQPAKKVQQEDRKYLGPRRLVGQKRLLSRPGDLDFGWIASQFFAGAYPKFPKERTTTVRRR